MDVLTLSVKSADEEEVDGVEDFVSTFLGAGGGGTGAAAMVLAGTGTGFTGAAGEDVLTTTGCLLMVDVAVVLLVDALVDDAPNPKKPPD